MSRLSIRPRPLDFHKKLAIVKSFKDFDDEETPTPTRTSQVFRFASEADTEVHHHVPNKRVAAEIPTPEFVIVDTYERDYSRSFNQPTTYIRARGARAEIGEFVEYDLDNEDEDWLDELNEDRKILSPDKLESILHKLEILDHKARERAGLITPTFGSLIPVVLQLDVAAESLQAQSIKYGVLESVYYYWREKRERWQKPILRRLQPPPPVNDTNPYNVFRPREKAHRLHTRRMQRRENNVQSFDKLRQVRRNLDQAKTILEALMKREEKKREVMETEVSLQRIQIKYKHEAELLEDSFVLPPFPPFSNKFNYSEDELVDSEDVSYTHPSARHGVPQNPTFMDIKPVIASAGNMRQESRWRNSANAWLHKQVPNEPIMAFTKSLVPDKLSAAGIHPPSDPFAKHSSARPVSFHGRMGRGGRIIFDRWNPVSYVPINCGDSMYIAPRHPPSTGFM
ncbi:Enhancer of polycomb homolog 2-like protein [Drosera capensis]